MQLNSILNHTFTSSGVFLRTNRVVEACDLMQTMEEMGYFRIQLLMRLSFSYSYPVRWIYKTDDTEISK